MSPLDRLSWLGVLARRDDLSPAQFRVAVVLAEFVNKVGIARPGLEHLAEESGLHRMTVSKSLRSLYEKGLLAKRAGGGRGNATEWRLVTPETPAETVATAATVCQVETPAETLAETVATSAYPTGDKRSTTSLSTHPQRPTRARARVGAPPGGSRHAERMENLRAWCSGEREKGEFKL